MCQPFALITVQVHLQLSTILTSTAKCEDFGVVRGESVQTRISSCEGDQIPPIPHLYFFTVNVLYPQFSEYEKSKFSCKSLYTTMVVVNVKGSNEASVI